jgi:pimeloyl-CoA dehydrogenase
MELQLLPEHVAFRDEVRRFIAERLPADIRDRLRLGHPPRKEDTVRWQRILNERGWAAPHWPKAYGGAELDVVSRLILQDETAAAAAPMPLMFNINMLGPVLIEFGTDQQKQNFLPKLANLDLWFCQGFSEPGSGSDLASLRTTARREGDRYIIDGQKIWTTSAHLADWIFALVRTDSSSRRQTGISFLLIDLRSPGITIRPIFSIDGMHHLNEVFFDSVEVPVGNIVGTEGDGWDVAKFLLNNERTGIVNVGAYLERLDYARELARKQTQGVRRLIDEPALQAELAILDAEVHALEVTNWRFLTSPESAPAAYASVLKLKGSELQQDIAEVLSRIAGPAGLERVPLEGTNSPDWRAPLTPRYFYSRAVSIYGGSSEVQKNIVSKAILG